MNAISFGRFLTMCAFLVLTIQPAITRNTHGNGNSKKLLDNWWTTLSKTNPKYAATTALLKSMEHTFPNLVHVYSIGKSVEKREMWVVQLSQNVKKWGFLKPSMKIVANMHGDETLGRALTLMLLVDILIKYNRNDTRAVELLKRTDIHLLPSMNPDGFERSVEGECSPDSEHLIGRLNVNLQDLNRDFPDQFVTNEIDYRGRQPETVNVMKWITNSYFVLSANLHALTLVASYPFDSVPLEMEADKTYGGAGVISRSPDHDVFFHIARQYANNHKTMGKYNNCSKGEFKNGVTNGAQWYNVRGGMQDFNYVHSNTFEITFELSCCKFVHGKHLLAEWENNRESLYKFVEVTHQMTLKGLVSNAMGKPIKHAQIFVRGIDHVVWTTPRGYYWRLLVPGSYQVWASAQGYQSSQRMNVDIHSDRPPNRLDFRLIRAN